MRTECIYDPENPEGSTDHYKKMQIRMFILYNVSEKSGFQIGGKNRKSSFKRINNFKS